jgi:long-chain fatty acid transport protein
MLTGGKLQAWAVSSALILLSAEAHSAAFMLNEQSTVASGRSYAGGAAAADDASTIFYNPAGMTELKRAQAQAGAYMIAPRAEISNNGSTASVGGGAAAPFVGTSDQGFDPQASGSLYLAAPATTGLWVGLGVTVPFALANHYDSDFFGRYDSTRASLRAIDIAPSVAYAIHPQVSIGGGIDIQYMDAKLVNALPNPFDPSGSPTPATDGRFAAEGSDWSLGYNVGALFKPTDKVRLGLTYRSAITHKIEGDATTDFNGTHTVQGASTDLKLPDTVALGVAYDVTPTVTLLGQVGYYGWSRFKEVRLKFADGTESATTENFRDTWSLALGAEWAVARGWKLRGGMLYDRTPTRDQFRSTIIPDVDRLWASIGATYQISDTLALDASYQHMFAKEGPINRTNSFPTLSTTVQTVGTTDTSADIVGITLRMQF